MNLFVTSECPWESARVLEDKRVVKMCLETAQLLSTAMAIHGAETTYKATHKGHPYKDHVDVNTAYRLYLTDRWSTDKRVPTWYGREKSIGEVA